MLLFKKSIYSHCFIFCIAQIMEEQVYQQTVNWNTVNNQEAPKEWLAIASFVLSLVWFNILWLIFWIIALNKKQLRWAALAWTIISAVKLVLGIFVFMWILAGALIPRIWAARDKANDVAREANVSALATAVVSYTLDNDGQYPSTIENLDLSKYAIPEGNYNGTPTYEDTYNYVQLDNWNHFVIYTELSCLDCGNCDNSTVSKMTDFRSVSDYITNGSWWSYCLAQ